MARRLRGCASALLYGIFVPRIGVEGVMADPFQNVSAAGSEFIEIFARQLEVRAAEPDMVGIVEAYLDDLPWDEITLAVEVGCGTGPVARRMARRSSRAQVVGIEPSPELVEHARGLAEGIANLRFETGTGEALPFADGAADAVVFHTVLCHVVDPVDLLAEAMRVLRPGGTLVVCDADFSKASLAGFEGDPLQACADFFVANYVTDPHLVAKIRMLVQDAGFQLRDFRIGSRTVTDADGMLVWVRLAGAMLVERGEIGQPLADALMGEYQRRKEAGRLYGHLPFATLIATRQV